MDWIKNCARCVTELAPPSFSYLWCIQNFSTLANEEIRSPQFECRWAKFELVLNPNHANDERIALVLLGYGNCSTVRNKFELSVMHENQYVFKVLDEPVKWESHYTKETRYAFIKLARKEDLKAFGSTLRIRCRIWLEDLLLHRVGSWNEWDQRELAESHQRRHMELLSNFNSLLYDPEFADLTITVENKICMAHKAVLCARSSVFRAMLSGGRMLESTQNAVEISDFDYDVVKAMLCHIYTGKVSDTDLSRSAKELLRIADKYDLGGLKEDAELELAATVSLDEAVDLLVIADLFRADKIMTRVIHFIRKNPQVMKTPEFQALAESNPTLVAKVGSIGN